MKHSRSDGGVLDDIFDKLMEFDGLSVHLLRSVTFVDWKIAFKRCYECDQRCTFLFLRHHGLKKRIPEAWILWANQYWRLPILEPQVRWIIKKA